MDQASVSLNSHTVCVFVNACMTLCLGNYKRAVFYRCRVADALEVELVSLCVYVSEVFLCPSVSCWEGACSLCVVIPALFGWIFLCALLLRDVCATVCGRFHVHRV
ncbi:hypothetical protein ATANTOWER_016230 [Ataeniobius toweri]|uniref:Uncharacterized protein n=1 Tax=Ataeniobius toweri TaxID=208326 RepID=A0ABU7CK00_9TELE|nr:hypothetical protein [Ataeniobius toweri]